LSFLTGSDQASSLLTGDEVTLVNAVGASGQFVIDRVTGPTVAFTTKPATEDLLDASVTLDTPFLRDTAPLALAQAMATASGLGFDGTDFDSAISGSSGDIPVQTPLSMKGLSFSGKPISLLTQGTPGLLKATFNAATDLNRRTLASPSSTWVAAEASNLFQLDWTPYLLTQPGTIFDSAPVAGTTGFMQADTNEQQIQGYGANSVFQEAVAYTAGGDPALGTKFSLMQSLATGVLAIFATRSVSQFTLRDDPAAAFYFGWIEWEPETRRHRPTDSWASTTRPRTR